MATFDYNPFTGTSGASILGADWAEYRATDGGYNSFDIHSSGSGVVADPLGQSRGVRYTGATIGASQFSKITLGSAGTISSQTSYPAVTARCSGATTTAHCYQFSWTPSAWYISRVVNGTGTNLGASISGAPANIAINDTMEIRVTDSGTVSTIEGFYNGASVGSRTYDHSGGTLASGTPGFEVYAQIASFIILGAEGGDLGGSGSTATAAAGAATVSAAGASTAATTATAAAGVATVSATSGTLTVLTSSVFKNNTGTVWASLTNVTAWVYHPTTGALVVKLTAQATNGSGVCVLEDALIVTATTYRVVFKDETSGAEGMETLTAG